MSCGHTKYVRRKVQGEWNDELERFDEVWRDVKEEAFVDTGLHTYKCEICNQQFLYSQRGPTVDCN